MVTLKELWDDKKFKLIRTLKYRDIVDFVFENIRLKNFSAVSYFTVNLLALAFLIGIIVYSIHSGDIRFKSILRSFLTGALAGSILIIPVHEMIHALSYKILGAPKIHFGADFKQMIFYVASDKFVLNRKSFYILAFSPFVVINVITLFITLNLSMYWVICSISFLLFHNIMCIGDFAMVSFFSRYKGKELFTYDDHKERTSYIFEKIKI